MIIKLELILSYILGVIYIFAICAALTRFFKKGEPLYLKLFAPFLFLTLIVEIAGHILNLKHIHNVPMYNFFIVIEFVFYFFVLYFLVKNLVIKKIIKGAIGLYPILAVIDIFYIHGINQYHTYTIILGSISVVLLCLLYIYESFKLKVLPQFTREPSFWICFGLLFFYSTTLPLMIMINLSWANSWNDTALVFIQILPNYVLYVCFAIAFLCKLKIRKIISSKANLPGRI